MARGWRTLYVVAGLVVAAVVLAGVPGAVQDVRAVGRSCSDGPAPCVAEVSGTLERGGAAGRRLVRRTWYVDPAGRGSTVVLRTGPLAGSLDRHVGETVTAEVRDGEAVAVVAGGDRTWALMSGWPRLVMAGVVLLLTAAIWLLLGKRRRR